jgi:hypothetical protein
LVALYSLGTQKYRGEESAVEAVLPLTESMAMEPFANAGSGPGSLFDTCSRTAENKAFHATHPSLERSGFEREDMPVVVWAKAGKTTVSGVTLEIAVDPRILLVIGIKLNSVPTRNGVGIFNSWHANLSLCRGRTEQSHGKGEDE